jgi:hypothetical protein
MFTEDFNRQPWRFAPMQLQDAHIGLGPAAMLPIRTRPLGLGLGLPFLDKLILGNDMLCPIWRYDFRVDPPIGVTGPLLTGWLAWIIVIFRAPDMGTGFIACVRLIYIITIAAMIFLALVKAGSHGFITTLT